MADNDRLPVCWPAELTLMLLQPDSRCLLALFRSRINLFLATFAALFSAMYE
jgi:hypothetical protein